MARHPTQADKPATAPPAGRGACSSAWALGLCGALACAVAPPALGAPPGLPPVAPNQLPLPCLNGACGGSHPYLQRGTVADPIISGNRMTINQTSTSAILNWAGFDIGAQAGVTFNQPSASATTLNRIWDGNPTQIFGQLTANGQIYLINRNGILFGNGARVDVGGLVASSLDMTSDRFSNGLLTDIQGNPAFCNDEQCSDDGNGGNGKVDGFVLVQNGARLTAAAGGSVMLLGPVVENNGVIRTPDGQTILAAGNRVYMEASQDPNLRGILVEVDNDDLSAADRSGYGVRYASGTASNLAAGDIAADRGNVTVIGMAVNQEGRISATTSVNVNGSIKLLARYNTVAVVNSQVDGVKDIRARSTGDVKLGTGSVTQVTPDLDDPTTTTDDQGFRPSIVEVMGRRVTMENGSRIVAPNGRVTLAAMSAINTTASTNGTNAYQEIVSTNSYSAFLNPAYSPDASYAGFDGTADPAQARVYLDGGSVIDVSGTAQAVVPVTRNVIPVELRGTELADAPLQRDGSLRNQTVYVDIREGTPLANYAGEEAGIGRTVAERTTPGGTVSLYSTGDAIVHQGATVDVSGGQVSYSGGYVRTTKLVSQGKLYDISEASPDRVYDGIADSYAVVHRKWGVTENWSTLVGDAQGQWDPGYSEGAAAGTVKVLAPAMVLDGDFLAATAPSMYQRQPIVSPALSPSTHLPAYKDTYAMLPRGGQLMIGYSKGNYDPDTGTYDFVTDSDVVFADRAAPRSGLSTAMAPLVPADEPVTVATGALAAHGFTGLSVYTNREVRVDPGGVTLPAGASLSVTAGRIDIAGRVEAPAGSLAFATRPTPDYDDGGPLSLAGILAVRGLWVNDLLTVTGGSQPTGPNLIDGGSVSLISANALTLGAGAAIDVSGGARLGADDSLQGGDGGQITLRSGSGGVASYPLTMADGVSFKGYGVASDEGLAAGTGGSLSIASGGGVLGSGQGVLGLANDFFRQGGFTAYSVEDASFGGNGITVSGSLAPVAGNLVLDRTAAVQAAGGTSLSAFAEARRLPDYLRHPASITLKSDRSDLQVNAGAAITVDPRGKISLASGRQLKVFGTLDAPGGEIDLAQTAGQEGYDTSGYIWLGAQSRLLSRGALLPGRPNDAGLVLGTVLDGGTIDIDGGLRAVVGEAGSVVDVSGTAADLDLAVQTGGGTDYRHATVAGNGGAVTVNASEGIFMDTAFAGHGGGSGTAGGSLAFVMDRNNLDTQNTNFPETDRQLVVRQSNAGGFAPAGMTAGDRLSAVLDGLGYVSAAGVESGGFDQLRLASQDLIRFEGGVNLSARRSVVLSARSVETGGTAADRAVVSAAYVAVGNTSGYNQEPIPPAAGNGSLEFDARLIDLWGYFALSGARQTSFHSTGDIRLNGMPDTDPAPGALPTSVSGTYAGYSGSLVSQGDLLLAAAQVYPTTLSRFDMAVVDGVGNPAGRVAFSAAGTQTPVLSAAGRMNVSAAEIDQGGVLKAPLGAIGLAADTLVLQAGSVTSVSGEGQLVPFGTIQGTNWVYDAGAVTGQVTTASLPQKAITLSGNDTTIAPGATLDISGGGDLYAYEFLAGPGGSRDVLSNAAADAGSGPKTFAVLPGMASSFAPYDPQYYGGSSLQPGTSVYLSGGGGLAAGYYALLPARYALLPGAYTVTLVPGYQDLQPGAGARLLDGIPVVAGKLAALTGDPAAGAAAYSQDARWSGFAVAPGTVARTQSEYHDNYAGQFFTAAAQAAGVAVPRLPQDAGQLVVAATGAAPRLSLRGNLSAGGADGGRGGLVDIDVQNLDIEVVAARDEGDPAVQLLAGDLNRWSAESLLIGGRRTPGDDGVQLATDADNVTVANGAAISGSEIILAAKSQVRVASGGTVEAKGTTVDTSSESLIASGDGALLRVSTGPQADVRRSGTAGATGRVVLEGGSRVAAADSVTLDSTLDPVIDPQAVIQGQALSLGASRISLGDTAGAQASGLVLTGELLTRLQQFARLDLRSYSTIDFYGNAGLGRDQPLAELNLAAGGLRGYGAASATIDAGSLTWSNPDGVEAGAYDAASGTLTVRAERFTQGEGDKAIQGFGSTSLIVAGDISGQGTGTLNVAGDLNLTASRLTLQDGADQGITATGRMTVDRGQPPQAPAQTFGAKLSLQADTILERGIIDLPTGLVSLRATGADGDGNGIVLADGAEILAGGLAKSFGDQVAYAPGGQVALQADAGNVVAQSGALVDVSAAGSGDAGSVSVVTPQGDASFADGTLQAQAESGARQGSFSLDADTVNAKPGTTGNDLSSLNAVLEAGGFTEARTLRVRSGNLAIGSGETVTAHDFQLTADGANGSGGNITVNGTVDARGRVPGEAGGTIDLFAQGDVRFTNAHLLASGADGTDAATGAGGSGGQVTVGTAGGRVDFDPDSRVDVSGGIAGGERAEDGTVVLRVPRAGYPDNLTVNARNITAADGTLPRQAIVEAYQSYQATAGAVDSLETQVLSDANAFLAAAASPDPALQLRPGVDIWSAGDLALNNSWDLYQKTSAPIMLTLRAQGDLNMLTHNSGFFGPSPAALSDGFDWLGTPASGPSASYRLVAGSDLSSADPLATVSGGGDFILGAGKVVKSGYFGSATFRYTLKQIRTGTGSIDIAAGGDVVFGNQQSVIYTAGSPDPNAPYAGAGNYYLSQGGDITVTTGGNVVSVPGDANTNQLITEWLQRTGSATEPSAWWINLGSFSQNLGALGGGNLTVRAGGDVTNLTASLPATGYYDEAGSGAPVTFGGGNLDLSAGGDIASGIFFVGKGRGTLSAGGSVTAAPGNLLHPILALEQGSWDVSARSDLTLETVVNPTVIWQGISQAAATMRTQKSFFFTYDQNGEVRLDSLAGNIGIGQTTANIVNSLAAINNSSVTHDEYTVYPATLQGTAFTGDIGISSYLTLYPSATGNLELLAGGDINVGALVTLADADPALLDGRNPQAAFSGGVNKNLMVSDVIHGGDAVPVTVVANGSIVGPNETQDTFDLPKAGRFEAGQDILYLSVVAQNLDPGDVTSLTAGRDIVLTPPGTPINRTNRNRVLVHGPGMVLLQAGRNVDLGTANGVVTDGNIGNPLIPYATGAGITVIAGAGRNGPDYQGFVDDYLTLDPNPDTDEDSELLAFSQQYLQYQAQFAADPGATPQQQRSAFNRGLPAQLRDYIQQAFYQQLRQSGRSGATGGDYAAGYQAIATLFPEADYSGNLTLYYSQIRTQRGGNIDLMVPGGMVNAGLSNPDSSLSKAKLSSLGIVTVAGGDVNAVVDGDFQVNSSRVFTLQGGNILIWSSEGSIDAGKGSKTASATPPPVLTFDPKTGKFALDTTASVTGSGIRVLLANKDVKPGDVDLFAPKGEISAGDAGIGSAGNLFVGAVRVVNADNFQAGGSSTGVPTANTGGLAAGFTSVSNLGGDATKAAEQTTAALSKQAQAAPAQPFMPSFLSVEVIGFGGS